VFTQFGAITGFGGNGVCIVGMVAGPIGLDFLKGINAPLVRVPAEVTLVLVLFIDD